ncbi:MAG: toprim domain-containing protein [bacterium]
METLKQLQQLFKRFPGIGERQAMRFAYFLATADENYTRDLIEQVTRLRKNVRRCARCYALSENIADGKCPVCNDNTRDKSMLLIVEKDADRDRFMQSRTYSGTYFVLGGLAPAIEKDASTHIRLEELSRLVSAESKSTLKEIILALSATPDGERTEALVTLQLQKSETKIPVSILGKGLSTGTEIEYSDADTLGNALRTRTKSE